MTAGTLPCRSSGTIALSEFCPESRTERESSGPRRPVLRTWCARPEEGRGQYDGSLLVAVTGVISGDTPATAVARRDRHRAFAPDAAPGLAQVLNAADEAGSKAVMTVYS